MKTWSDLPVFLSVVETGSLTAAGKALNLSQPTVGRRIRALEDHFGMPLVKKRDGMLVPTDFGQSILDPIRRMSDEAHAIERVSASLDTALAGIVRLSATEGIGTRWMPPVLQQFRRAHPEVLIEMAVDFRAFNLAQREADIAIRWGGPGVQNSLIARKVATTAFGFFASQDYINRRGQPESLEDLVYHDGVLAMVMEDIPLWYGSHVKAPATQYLPRRTTFRTNNIWAFETAIESGYGIGYLPLVTKDRKSQDLIRVLPDVSETEDMWIVAHEDLKRSPRIRAVFDFLVEAFKQDADCFLGLCDSVFMDPPQMANVAE